jgi:hypothetical protein
MIRLLPGSGDSNAGGYNDEFNSLDGSIRPFVCLEDGEIHTSDEPLN